MGKIIARSLGNHAAVSVRRIKAEIFSAGVIVAQHAATADVRFAASASRVYETLVSVAGATTADLAVGHGSRFHLAHVENGRATSAYRKSRLFDSDLLGAIGFDYDVEEIKAVFGAIKASAPDSTTDAGSGYLTADGKITADRAAARATWVAAAANRR